MDVKLIYQNPNMGKLIEYAGRVCYNSYPKMTPTSYETFIKNLVKCGHESVIEHSLLIFELQNVSSFYKEITELMFFNHLININFTIEDSILLSGNLRMFKDLIRSYKRTVLSDNKVIEAIVIEMKKHIPSYFFDDMISDPYMEFKDLDSYNVKLVENDIAPQKISNYVYLLQDNSPTVPFGSEYPPNFNYRTWTITYLVFEPRFTTHQEVRHRTASYSQESQRYVSSKDCKFYYPSSPSAPKMREVCENLRTEYCNLTDNGMKLEDARMILPNNIMSKIVITRTYWDLLFNYLPTRLDKAAQQFIRVNIATPLKTYIIGKYPHLKSYISKSI